MTTTDIEGVVEIDFNPPRLAQRPTSTPGSAKDLTG
jgi:hypothetical protein